MNTTVDRAEAARERRRAIYACHLCDEYGWLRGTDRLPLEPAVRCSHAYPVENTRRWGS